jgi:protein O-GlcNAc transferase
MSMPEPTVDEIFVLATEHLKAGRLAEAEQLYQQVVAQKPDYAEAYCNLGNTLRQMGRFEDSVTAYRRAIAINNDLPEIHNNLGIALKRLGRLDEAIASYRQAIAQRPDYAKAHSNLGGVLRDMGLVDEAIAQLEQAVAINPNLSASQNNLGTALKDKHKYDASIEAHCRAIALSPDNYDAFNNLANVLKEIGEVEESILACKEALALNPNFEMAYSNLLLAMHYCSGYDGRAIAQELQRWNARFGEPLPKFIEPHTNDPDPERRLRIGYVSPDFRNHPVGRNLLPWFHLHDREQFEIFCYAQVFRPDALTARFKENVDAWRSTAYVPDEKVARQIREDRIDILVDLALHTGDHRLLVFAQKPAPVQVSYLGYPGSTGLKTVDWRISDPYIDPPGADESCYTEKTVRLAKSYWCYHPGVDPRISPTFPPVVKNGFVTFGCQNNYCKISPATWETWMAILRASPNSKLLVYSAPGSHREKAKKRFEAGGIDPSRLVFSEARKTEYFLRYNEMDVALDPFPFGGGTTTCDALWMGVPVVSLSGQTAVGRGGKSILGNLGLGELVANSIQDYIRIALDLAKDVKRMTSLRAQMRNRMLASPLMDGEGFVRDLEAVYRRIWRKWCES